MCGPLSLGGLQSAAGRWRGKGATGALAGNVRLPAGPLTHPVVVGGSAAIRHVGDGSPARHEARVQPWASGTAMSTTGTPVGKSPSARKPTACGAAQGPEGSSDPGVRRRNAAERHPRGLGRDTRTSPEARHGRYQRAIAPRRRAILAVLVATPVCKARGAARLLILTTDPAPRAGTGPCSAAAGRHRGPEGWPS